LQFQFSHVMNQDTRIFGHWAITVNSVSTMLEAFKNGVEFIVKLDQCGGISKYTYAGWCREDTKQKFLYVKVTNEERRRLIPILKGLNTEMNRFYRYE
jgi:hypothetical protein